MDWSSVVSVSQTKQRRNGLTDWRGVVAASQKKQRRNGLTDRSSVVTASRTGVASNLSAAGHPPTTPATRLPPTSPESSRNLANAFDQAR